MRVMMVARIPHEEFNDAVRDGTTGEKMQSSPCAAKTERLG